MHLFCFILPRLGKSGQALIINEQCKSCSDTLPGHPTKIHCVLAPSIGLKLLLRGLALVRGNLEESLNSGINLFGLKGVSHPSSDSPVKDSST